MTRAPGDRATDGDEPAVEPPGTPPPVYPPAAVPPPEAEPDPAEEVGLPEAWPVVPPTD